MSTLAELARRVHLLILPPERLKKTRDLAENCLADKKRGHIDALQFPTDPENEYDWTPESLARERGQEECVTLTVEQTALVVAALHDAYCHNVEPVIPIREIDDPATLNNSDHRRVSRWRVIREHVRNLGQFAVHWYTLQVNHFESIVAASIEQQHLEKPSGTPHVRPATQSEFDADLAKYGRSSGTRPHTPSGSELVRGQLRRLRLIWQLLENEGKKVDFVRDLDQLCELWRNHIGPPPTIETPARLPQAKSELDKLDKSLSACDWHQAALACLDTLSSLSKLQGIRPDQESDAVLAELRRAVALAPSEVDPFCAQHAFVRLNRTATSAHAWVVEFASSFAQIDNGETRKRGQFLGFPSFPDLNELRVQLRVEMNRLLLVNPGAEHAGLAVAPNGLVIPSEQSDSSPAKKPEANSDGNEITDAHFFAPYPPPTLSLVVNCKGKDRDPRLPTNWPPMTWESDVSPLDDSREAMAQWFAYVAGRKGVLEQAKLNERNKTFSQPFPAGKFVRDAWTLVRHLRALGKTQLAVSEENRSYTPHEALVELESIAFGLGLATAAKSQSENGLITRNKVFISYSHKDKRFCDELRVHLKPLVRNERLSVWSDNQIRPGSKWFDKIKNALADTNVAVMLVTKDFLASDFIHENELGPLLKNAEQDGVQIIWVMVSACNYDNTPLRAYQAVNSPDKPIAGMKKAERDKTWVAICKEILKAAESKA